MISLLIAKSKKKKIYHRRKLNHALYGRYQPYTFGARKIKTISLSNDTVLNRINMMSDDIRQQLLKKIKRSKIYDELYESTDITSKALF